MIEIISLLVQLLIFCLIFSYPLNKTVFIKLNLPNNFSLFEIYGMNIIIHLFIYSLISFFYINLKFLFISEIILASIFLYQNKKNFLNSITLNNSYSFFLFLIICFSFFVAIGSSARLEWDALAHWIFKAQVYFQNGSYQDFKSLPFNYYPQLGTFLWGYFWQNDLIYPIEYKGRLSYVFLYLISIFFIIEKNKKSISVLYPATVFLIILLTLDSYLFSGYQDYLIFIQLVFISKLIYLYKKDKNNFYLILVFLSCWSLMWTKQEGFFYFIIIGLTLIMFGVKDLKKKIFLILIFSISIFLKSFLQEFIIGSFNFNEPILHSGLLRYLDISNFLSAFYIITWHILISFFKYPIWLMIFLVIIIYNKNNFENYEIFYFIVYFLFIYSIYFQTSMSLKELLPVTIDRLLLQGSGFLIFPIFRILYNKKNWLK